MRGPRACRSTPGSGTVDAMQRGMRTHSRRRERGSTTFEYLIAVVVVGVAATTALRASSEGAKVAAECVVDRLTHPGRCRAAASGAPQEPRPIASLPAPAPTPDATPPSPASPAVPAPSPGPAPVAPAPDVGPALPSHIPPIAGLPLGTPEGGGVQLDNTAAKQYVIDKTAARTRTLLKAGRDRNTTEYGPEDALDVVAGMTGDIDAAAAKYGIDRALLAGVIASEVDFDTDWKDVVQNGAAELGIYRGQGQGLANVHLDSLQAAQRYLIAHGLPGADAAAQFEATPANVYANPAEAAAIVLAHQADLKRRAGGATSSAQDMAIIFGAYRNGEENFDLSNNRNSNGGDELAQKTGDPRAVVGTDAYQSEAYFEYYIEYYEAVERATSTSGGRTEI